MNSRYLVTLRHLCQSLEEHILPICLYGCILENRLCTPMSPKNSSVGFSRTKPHNHNSEIWDKQNARQEMPLTNVVVQ